MNELEQAISILTKKRLKQVWNNNSSKILEKHIPLIMDLEDNNKNNYATYVAGFKKDLIENNRINMEEYIIDTIILPIVINKMVNSDIDMNQSIKLSLKETDSEDFPIILYFNLKISE